MNRSIKALLIAAAVTGFAGAGIAAANPAGDGKNCARPHHVKGFRHHHGDDESRMERMAEVLGLTQEQRTTVRAIIDKARPQKRELRDKLRENRKQLNALVQAGTPNESEVRRIADAQGRTTADMIVLRTKVRTEINAVLTPEQREKMQNMRRWHRSEKSSQRRDAAVDTPDAASWDANDRPQAAALLM